MSNRDLESNYPKLRIGNYKVESPRDPGYNCIAWAAGSNELWYERAEGTGMFWPSELSEGYTVDSWIEVFRLQGYEVDEGKRLEPDFQRVAIYADEDGPTHVARLKPTGSWTSKLGKGHDIEHATLNLLEGTDGREYGHVARILKRPWKVEWTTKSEDPEISLLSRISERIRSFLRWTRR